MTPMKWFFSFLKKYRGLMIIGILLTTAVSVLSVVNPYISGQIVDQALCTDPSNPATEFFVGLCDVRFGDFPENYLPLHLKDLTSDPATQSPILHTSGELRQKLFKICTAMSVENDVCRSGRYIMLKSYQMQMLILLLREQSEPVKINTGCSFESTSKKYVVDQIVNYFEDHYSVYKNIIYVHLPPASELLHFHKAFLH